MTGMAVFRKVMIVDDEQTDQLLVRRVLQKSGLVGEICGFIYAEDALVHLRETPVLPDVIFLDINMPRMSGIEFLEVAERELGAIPASAVVMLTTSMAPTDRDRAERFPQVRAFIVKPMRAPDLSALVETLAAGPEHPQ